MPAARSPAPIGVLIDTPGGIAVSTLWLLLLFKGLAWSISLASFRGGSVFPAIFLGTVGGLLAARLPEFSEAAAVAVVMAVATVSTLRLPLASVLLVLLLTADTGQALIRSSSSRSSSATSRPRSCASGAGRRSRGTLTPGSPRGRRRSTRSEREAA